MGLIPGSRRGIKPIFPVENKKSFKSKQFPYIGKSFLKWKLLFKEKNRYWRQREIEFTYILWFCFRFVFYLYLLNRFYIQYRILSLFYVISLPLRFFLEDRFLYTSLYFWTGACFEKIWNRKGFLISKKNKECVVLNTNETFEQISYDGW